MSIMNNYDDNFFVEENNSKLSEYIKKINVLPEEEQKIREAYLKQFYNGNMQGPLTGVKSVDKPELFVRNQMPEYRKKVAELSYEDSVKRDLYLKEFYNGNIQGPLTGFPSLDKPYLQYYEKEAIDIELPNLTAAEYLFNENKNRLSNIAINFYGTKITYRKLFDEKQAEVEKAFRSLGVKRGDYVTFCMPTLPETVYAFYALNAIGVICNMIDLRMNKENILKCINETKSKFVISFNNYSENVYNILEESTATKLIDVDITDSLSPLKAFLYRKKVPKAFDPNKPNVITWKQFIKNGEKDETEYKDTVRVPNRGEYPAAIVYTGGTTGNPKGAVITNNCLNVSAIQYKTADIPRGKNDRFLEFMPPFIAYGLINGIHFPLSLGMEDVLLPKFGAEDFYPTLKKYKTPHFVGIPYYFGELMNDPRCEGLDLSFIKNAGCGGDTIPEDLELKFNEFLREHNCNYQMRTGYGLTENSAMSIYDTNDKMIKNGYVGIPMQKMKIGVFDEDGNERGYNEEGELYINSPEIIKEYYNNKEETDKAIVNIYGERWIKTKDIAVIAETGHAKIIDRGKNMIVRPDGHNVWPSKIRNGLYSCPIIDDLWVVGIKSKYITSGVGRIPTAVVVLKDKNMDKEVAKEIIFEYQSHLFGERDGALDIRFRDSLPRTPVGKIDTTRITKEENEQPSEIDYATLTNNVKKKVLK